MTGPYCRSLQVAVQHGLRSISFPSISTGAFAYPIRLAAPIALRTIIEFVEREPHSLEEVQVVLYTREYAKAYMVFVEALDHILAKRVTDGDAAPEAVN